MVVLHILYYMRVFDEINFLFGIFCKSSRYFGVAKSAVGFPKGNAFQTANASITINPLSIVTLIMGMILFTIYL